MTIEAGKLALEAHAFATAAHEGQKRKWTGEPYILHCMRVAGTVASVTSDWATLAAAIMHDVLEDTDVTEAQMRTRFGDKITDMVVALTNVPPGPGLNRAIRHAMDCDRLSAASAAVQNIKLADLIDNTASIMEHDPKFAETYMPEKIALLDVLTKGDKGLRSRAWRHVDLWLKRRENGNGKATKQG